ncbi:hypothetical protein ACFCYC_25395 [Streptomyces sp. NPDC056402]
MIRGREQCTRLPDLRISRLLDIAAGCGGTDVEFTLAPQSQLL